MAAAGVRIEITAAGLERARAELRGLWARIRDPHPVLQEFGVHMVRSIEQTFEAGGRPVAWPPSIRARTRGGKTLIDTARLKNSIVPRVEAADTLRIGTTLPYAAAHQLGVAGAVQVPQHLRRVASRDVHQRQVRISASGKKRMVRRKIASGFAVVKAHVRNLRIPARPFLAVQDADVEILRAMLARHATGEER